MSAQLPHSTDAERGVLGSMMIDAQVAADVCQKIKEEKFYEPAHQIIFRVFNELVGQGRSLDLIVITKLLIDRRLIDSIGGPVYITELLSFVPTSANVGEYIEILNEKWERREIYLKCKQASIMALTSTDDINEVRSFGQNALLQLTSTTGANGHSLTMSQNVRRAVSRVEEIEQGLIQPGLTTGLKALDDLLGGQHNGEVTILMGATGGGKTSLAHNIADHVAVELQKGVMIFSYEMNALQVTNRMLSARASVNTKSFRTGKFNDGEMASLVRHIADFEDDHIFIEDDVTLDIDALRARARRRIATDQISLIIIDYLQKIPISAKDENSRQREVARISDGIQKMAMELNLPVIALSQRNKQGGAREAQDIEFDAKTILDIRRTLECDVVDEPLAAPRKIVVAKNNNGEIGITNAMFLKQYVRFEDYYPEPEMEKQYEPKKKKSW